MAKIDTSEFLTHYEVVVAVEHRLVSPEACRFAELYHRGMRVREKREEEIQKSVFRDKETEG